VGNGLDPRHRILLAHWRSYCAARRAARPARTRTCGQDRWSVLTRRPKLRNTPSTGNIVRYSPQPSPRHSPSHMVPAGDRGQHGGEHGDPVEQHLLVGEIEHHITKARERRQPSAVMLVVLPAAVMAEAADLHDETISDQQVHTDAVTGLDLRRCVDPGLPEPDACDGLAAAFCAMVDMVEDAVMAAREQVAHVIEQLESMGTSQQPAFTVTRI